MTFGKDRKAESPVTPTDPMALMMHGFKQAAQPVLDDLVRQVMPVLLMVVFVAAILGGLLGGLVAVVLT